MTYTIAPMTMADIPQAAELERLCFPDPWSERLLREQLENEGAAALAALGEEGTLLGYASLSVVLDEGYIANVAVRPEHRRQGIARALLEALRRLARSRRLAFLTLEVRASNAAAIALYESQGYREAGRRRGYYRHPAEDAIIMTLEFDYDTDCTDCGGAEGGL